jgi:GxxExxY protein
VAGSDGRRGGGDQAEVEVRIHHREHREHRDRRRDQPLDLLVEGKVILELKAVEQLHPVHEAQLLTYLKLSGCRIGLLINFNVKLLKDGIKRRVLD